MDTEQLRKLLEQIKHGDLDVEEAIRKLKALPFEDLGFARVDGHRDIRCGFPEVIFCTGKRVEDIVRIAQSLISTGGNLLATRATPEAYAAIKEKLPKAEYHERGRVVTLRQHTHTTAPGTIMVVSAGTSDIPVAEEARVTAEIMDNKVQTLYDVGVAGLHRLLSNREELTEASVVVVVAGMEGALASVVGGLVACPVIAVPTSIGYGASFSGIAPLLTMLNSCAPGIAVVNIDNGFGAGYMASLINHCGEEAK